ncbi:MAG: tetratricopeptide repeat protein [Pseudomonadota bacterium]
MSTEQPTDQKTAEIIQLPIVEHGRVDELNCLAEAQLTVDARRAFELASEARQLAEHCGYQEGRAVALYNQGICARLQSDYETALPLFRLVLKLYEDLGDQHGVAQTLQATGFVYDELGDYARALDYYLRALKINEVTGDQASRANTLRTIGIIYSKSGDSEHGLGYYRQSLELSQQVGDRLATAKTLNNIGISLKNLGRYHQALAALNEGLDFFRETGNHVGEAGVLNNVGITFDLIGRNTEAEKTLFAALHLSRQIGYTQGEMNALLSLGKLCSRHHRLGAARTHLHEALACAEKMKAKPARYECHQALAALYKKLEEYRLALDHCEAFHFLEREVFNEQSDRKLKGLQMSFQLNEVQCEAEIHRLRNVELARAYEELRSLNQALQLADQVKNELLAQLEKQNQEDSLTGLSNRRCLDARLVEEFRRAVRHRRALSVALVDIDFFKRVNDTFSHAIGDETLKVVATILRNSCRDTDMVARYGGEEFVILLLEMDVKSAAWVCQKARKAVENYDWTTIHPNLKVTISIGLSDDTNVESHEKLLAAADAKLYEAKYNGRNQVQW